MLKNLAQEMVGLVCGSFKPGSKKP